MLRFQDNNSVVIAKVDCTENSSTCKDSDVNGYPTLKIFRAGKELAEHEGARSVEAMKEFVEKYAKDEKEMERDEL